jgi:hypothetical protein
VIVKHVASGSSQQIIRRPASRKITSGAIVEYARPVTAIAPYDLRERTFRFTCDVYGFCREAKYWLRVAHDRSLGAEAARLQLLREVDELTAILTTAMKRLRKEP